MQIVLTSAGVAQVFVDCVYRRGEPEAKLLQVHGLHRDAELFHVDRVQASRDVILAMLAELPDVFRGETGAPASQAKLDRYGNQWTGVDFVVSQLVALGVAIGAVQLMGDPSRLRSRGERAFRVLMAA